MTIHTAKCIFNAFHMLIYICELHDFMNLAGTELFSFSFDLEVVLSMPFHSMLDSKLHLDFLTSLQTLLETLVT